MFIHVHRAGKETCRQINDNKTIKYNHDDFIIIKSVRPATSVHIHVHVHVHLYMSKLNVVSVDHYMYIHVIHVHVLW